MALLWYTLFSKPRKETQIESYLKSKGVVTFYPTLTIDPVNPRAAKRRGFFPRYLFVQADFDEVGVSVFEWVPGAVSLVQFGGEPAIVPDEFIQTLKARLLEIEKIGGVELASIKKGDRVKITSGPFAGQEAVFDIHLSSEQRVQVLLKWLGRQIKLRLAANGVEKRSPR